MSTSNVRRRNRRQIQIASPNGRVPALTLLTFDVAVDGDLGNFVLRSDAGLIPQFSALNGSSIVVRDEVTNIDHICTAMDYDPLNGLVNISFPLVLTNLRHYYVRAWQQAIRGTNGEWIAPSRFRWMDP
jgi:hypothetical protein